MVQTSKKIAESSWFNNFIIAMIILAGILVGIETEKSIANSYGAIINFLDGIVLFIFTVEIVIKMVAEGNKPWNYFRDSWNQFDFMIVFLSLIAPILPIDTSFLPILRLVRIFRVIRLVTAIPNLRLLVEALLRSLSSIFYIGLFLLLLFYIYGTMAVIIFGENDPIHFKNIPLAVLSLFRVITLEDWTDVMYINMYGCDQYGYGGYEHLCTNPSAMPVGGALFFVSFVAIGTMIVLNLFIGIVLKSMDKVEEQEKEKEKENFLKALKSNKDNSMSNKITYIQEMLNSLNMELDLLKRQVDKRELENF